MAAAQSQCATIFISKFFSVFYNDCKKWITWHKTHFGDNVFDRIIFGGWKKNKLQNTDGSFTNDPKRRIRILPPLQDPTSTAVEGFVGMPDPKCCYSWVTWGRGCQLLMRSLESVLYKQTCMCVIIELCEHLHKTIFLTRGQDLIMKPVRLWLQICFDLRQQTFYRLISPILHINPKQISGPAVQPTFDHAHPMMSFMLTKVQCVYRRCLQHSACSQ